MSNDHKDCYGCTKRTLGCHAVCEIYKKNSEKNKERLKKIARWRAEQNDIIGYQTDAIAKSKRKRGAGK
jgi:hypothetical protein